MRVETRKKITDMSTRYKGDISTKELLHEGLTNRQITASVEEGLLEKISHGHYWFRCGNYNKPVEYKALEISITAPDAVICADSACYFWGLIEKEPDSLSVATKRSDRKKIHMNFPVKRHYFSADFFIEDRERIDTEFGHFFVYGMERSVCDCIRFRNDMEPDVFDCIIETYSRRKDKTERRLMAYAEKLHMVNKVKDYL